MAGARKQDYELGQPLFQTQQRHATTEGETGKILPAQAAEPPTLPPHDQAGQRVYMIGRPARMALFCRKQYGETQGVDDCLGFRRQSDGAAEMGGALV